MLQDDNSLNKASEAGVGQLRFGESNIAYPSQIPRYKVDSLRALHIQGEG